MSSEELSVIDWDGVFHAISKYPSHVILVWLKTIGNAWITSRRMHEVVRHRCPFCDTIGAEDCLVHFSKCNGLAFLVGLSCSCALPLPPAKSMSFLCLPRIHHCNIEQLYISFTLYHTARNTRPNFYYNNISSQEVQRSLLELCKAARMKWSSFVPSRARPPLLPSG